MRIVPLSLENFRLLIEDIQLMEKNLGLAVSGESLEEHVREAMQGLLQKALQSKENYLWHTNWQIVLKEENRTIGSACFKGCPNEDGEVEVGYGINSQYQNKGYMTEALRAISTWAFGQPGVLYVTAETEKSNIPSHRVLQKLGMEIDRETGNCFWWKLSGLRFNA